MFVTAASATQIKKVVIIVTMPVPTCEAHLEHFLSRFTQLGYKNGENLDLVIIRANGDRQFAENELKKSVRQGEPDAVVTIATLASQAAFNVLKDTSVPIFFFQVSDPVGASLIKKIGAKTASNITGRAFSVPNDIRINLVMRLIGQAQTKRPVRFGYIYSSYPSAVGELKSLQVLQSKQRDIFFEPYLLQYRSVPDGIPQMIEEVKAGIQTLSDSVDFWWQPQGPLGELDVYTEILQKNSNIPIAIGPTLSSVKDGALIHITPDIEASGRESAELVDKILKGTHPGDMPVTFSAAFDVGLNMSTAQKLNIVVPPDLIELAGENIYH
ncbi:ABC transporter substrate-binding protein [Desulforhopalus sp. 52FAK]